MSWQRAFLAVSLALGADVDGALDALGTARAPAEELARSLRTGARADRARALAAALTAVAVDVEKTGLS